MFLSKYLTDPSLHRVMCPATATHGQGKKPCFVFSLFTPMLCVGVHSKWAGSVVYFYNTLGKKKAMLPAYVPTHSLWCVPTLKWDNTFNSSLMWHARIKQQKTRLQLYVLTCHVLNISANRQYWALPCFMPCFSCRAGWIFSICFVRKSIFLLKKALASSAVWRELWN